jgi:hypothetical protein
MLLFQGWRTLIPPVTIDDFVASYISVSRVYRSVMISVEQVLILEPQILLFIVLAAAYFFKTRGFNPSNWHVRANRLVGLEAVGPIVVSNPNTRDPCKFCGQRHRRGVLVLPKEKGITVGKGKAVLEWIWTWLK